MRDLQPGATRDAGFGAGAQDEDADGGSGRA